MPPANSSKISVFRLLESASNLSWVRTNEGHASGHKVPVRSEVAEVPTYRYTKRMVDKLLARGSATENRLKDARNMARENLKRIGKLDGLSKAIMGKIEALPDEILENLLARTETIERIAKKVSDLLSRDSDVPMESMEFSELKMEGLLESQASLLTEASEGESDTSNPPRKLWRHYGDELESDQYRRNQNHLNSRHKILVRGDHLHHVYIHFERIRAGIINRYIELAKAVGIELDSLEDTIKGQINSVLKRHLEELSRAIDDMPMRTVEKFLSQEGGNEFKKAFALFELRLSEQIDKTLSVEGLNAEIIKTAKRGESIFADELDRQRQLIEAQQNEIEEMRARVTVLTERLDEHLSN